MRKDSREVALRVLYSNSFIDQTDPAEEIFSYTQLNEQDKAFCDSLIKAVNENKQTLLEELSEISKNYTIDRMFETDKLILLLAMAEMKFFDDIPPLVTIKEAMDLSKKYSSEDSVTFINGILAGYKNNMEKTNGWDTRWQGAF